MLTLKDNPPMQHPEGTDIQQMPGQWWVAHTKPRQEKALARDILRLGGSYYLPMYEKILCSRGRKWKSLVVMFPGYLFLCGDGDDRVAALKTQRLVRTIEVQDQETLIRELEGIKRMIMSSEPVNPVFRLPKGTAVRITAGPLAGLEGRVERHDHRNKFVLIVSMLGLGASVEIESDLIEPL